MASTSLTRTMTAGDRDKFTVSAWVKRGILGVAEYYWSCYTDASNYSSAFFDTDNTLHWYNRSGGGAAGQQLPSRLFRDPGAWYHIVTVWDSAASAADRMRIYVNGDEVTSFLVDGNPTSGQDSQFGNSGSNMYLGQRGDAGSYFGGSLAHVHVCDGYAYAASDFGETDSTSGIWIAKTSPSVTYGTNGGFYKFASGALGTDSSGEGNTMTVSGTMTTTKDTPDNNFCTMNPLDNFYAGDTFSNGNTTATTSTAYGYSRCTQSLSTGKWYWEIKATTIAATDYTIGIASKQSLSATDWVGSTSESYSYVATDGKIYTSAAGTAYGDTYSAGDIIGVYLDLDNNKLYFAKNGTVQNSGTGISITAAASAKNGNYFPATGYNDASAAVYEHNFGGCSAFAISSGNTDANGYGNFEYDPSAGTFDSASKSFLALCTKNLAENG